MEKQLSIIIPTYNMEMYIGACLDSLLIPEFGAVEVLVVNDGSTDRSSEIAHSYARRYPESISVIDKDNGNYGSCINVALPRCTGRYIKILDADDSFEPIAFSKFVRWLQSVKSDLVLSHYAEVNEDKTFVKTSTNHRLESYYSSGEIRLVDALKDVFSRRIPMHMIAYNRDVFSKFNYRQTEGLSYTDTEWAVIPMIFCATFSCCDLVLYRYLVGRNGQTMDSTVFSASIDKVFAVYENIIKFVKECVMPEYSRECINRQLYCLHTSIYNFVINSKVSESFKILANYDLKLKTILPELYETLDCVSYDSSVKYKVFKNLRRRGYPSDFDIPKWVTFLIVLKNKLHF